MPSSNTTLMALTLIAMAGFGCQSGSSGASNHAATTPAGESAADAAPGALALTDNRPLESESATLTVGGLGCPLCANNIENKLGGMKGVQNVSVDLATGKVRVGLWGKDKPSPLALATAVKDSGFTPTGIQIP